MNDRRDEWNEAWYPDAPDDDELEFEQEGFIPAPVKFPMQDHGEVGSHYRNPGDDVNVIRVHNPDPDGCVRIAKNIAVNGTSHKLDETSTFVFGKEQSLTLVAEPDNMYDKNAIMVIGSHQDEDGKWHEEHVGYVPRKLAAKVNADELIVNLKTMFIPFQGKNPGIRMDLWKKDDLFLAIETMNNPVIKNTGFEELPPPPDSKHEPTWYREDGYYGDEPF